MDENEYRIMGIIYAILGVELFFFFIINESVLGMLFDTWIWVSPGTFWGYFLIFIIALVMVVGSLVLALFGVILVVRGGVWVARVSGVLFVFLFIMLVDLVTPVVFYTLV